MANTSTDHAANDSRAHMPAVVFSCLYGESEDFLSFLIFNFLNHTSESDFLLINLPSHLQHINESDLLSSRVILKKGGASRRPWGHTLLGAHVENFRLAETRVPSFQYFVAMASNSLFFRPFKLEAALAVAQQNSDSAILKGISIEALPDAWHWPKFKSASNLIYRLEKTWNVEKYCSNQIEGFFVKKDDWGAIAEIAEDVASYADGCDAPLEEIIPSTLLHKKNTSFFANICHVHWDRTVSQGFREVGVQDILEPVAMPDHIIMQKWFRRSCSAETLAVSTPLGLHLTQAVQTIDSPKQYLGLRALLANYQQQLSERVVRASIFDFPNKKRSANRQSDPVSEVSKQIFQKKLEISCIANRQAIPLEAELFPGEQGGQQSFLWMEQNGNEAKITFELFSNEVGPVVLKVSCKGASRVEARQDKELVLFAYCYIPVDMTQNVGCALSLEVTCDTELMAQQIAQRIAIKNGNNILVMQPFEASVTDRGVVASYDLLNNNERPSIGFPIYLNSDMSVRLDIVRLVALASSRLGSLSEANA